VTILTAGGLGGGTITTTPGGDAVAGAATTCGYASISDWGTALITELNGEFGELLTATGGLVAWLMKPGTGASGETCCAAARPDRKARQRNAYFISPVSHEKL